MAGQGYNNRRGLGLNEEYRPDPMMQRGPYRGGGRMDRGPYTGNARYQPAGGPQDKRRPYTEKEMDDGGEGYYYGENGGMTDEESGFPPWIVQEPDGAKRRRLKKAWQAGKDGWEDFGGEGDIPEEQWDSDVDRALDEGLKANGGNFGRGYGGEADDGGESSLDPSTYEQRNSYYKHRSRWRR